MIRPVASFFIGCLFAIGLALAGLLNPASILAFLDVAGNSWNPAPLIVLGLAVALYAVGFPIIMRRHSPVLDSTFHVPPKRAVDRNLIAGSIVFGIGWGLSGFCPGPAIAGLAFGKKETAAFVAAMFLGAWICRIFHEKKT